MVEESQKKKKQSEANLYVVPFCRYNLNESMPLTMMKHLDEEVPPVFMILDTFDKDVKSLLPGEKSTLYFDQIVQENSAFTPLW